MKSYLLQLNLLNFHFAGFARSEPEGGSHSGNPCKSPRTRPENELQESLRPPQTHDRGHRQLVSEFNDELLNGILIRTKRRRWRSVVIPYQNIELLNDQFFDGAIMISGERIAMKWHERYSIPLVVINNFGSALNHICSVFPDADGEVRAAMEHLIALGHTRIARIRGCSPWSTGEDGRTRNPRHRPELFRSNSGGENRPAPLSDRGRVHRIPRGSQRRVADSARRHPQVRQTGPGRCLSGNLRISRSLRVPESSADNAGV